MSLGEPRRAADWVRYGIAGGHPSIRSTSVSRAVRSPPMAALVRVRRAGNRGPRVLLRRRETVGGLGQGIRPIPGGVV